ncbi:hemerythrin domain-containing protein [Streptomyces sp. NBC_01476]|uniref:hemerythrin domain-containing protein n=1 Tax=Streptomyces sp. NBC_01476 TaxID=2903881 RepID=UPI002E2F48E8|nr:hemerythrin domain-containing protein [Streptomyces sp. NBC_01476]
MADVRDMYMAHTMLRREFRLLPQAVLDVAANDTKRAEVVALHVELVCGVLHLHHEGEDLVLWPLLLERGGEASAAIVPTMEEQHNAIHRAYDEVTGLLPGWRATGQGGEELARALEQLLSALVEHLALEEKEILPLAEKHVTAAEWNQLAEHGFAKSSKKTLPLTFGMAMYEADPELIKDLLAQAPPPARLIMPLLGPRLYASRAQRVYGTRTPPRVGA